MYQYNRDFSTCKQNNTALMAMKKLNEALSAFNYSLKSINISVKNFHNLANECKKYKL